MENRSHALLAGLFTLALLVAAVLVAVWIGRDRSVLTTYELVSSSTVSGLTSQSPVRYQGVPVGRVTGLSLDPDQPGRVRVRIGIAANTPITESTWAELGVRGLTGQATVELKDDGHNGKRLQGTPDQPARIPIHPGLLEHLEDRGTAILANVETLTRRMNDLLSQENVSGMSATLDNARQASQSLRTLADDLTPAAKQAGPLLASLTQVARQADQLTRQMNALTLTAQRTLARMSAPGGQLDTATMTMREIAAAAARLNEDTLPRISSMAVRMNNAARGVTQTAQRIGDRPQSFLFGPARARPGPGEAGFAGFGGQQP